MLLVNSWVQSYAEIRASFLGRSTLWTQKAIGNDNTRARLVRGESEAGFGVEGELGSRLGLGRLGWWVKDDSEILHCVLVMYFLIM